LARTSLKHRWHLRLEVFEVALLVFGAVLDFVVFGLTGGFGSVGNSGLALSKIHPKQASPKLMDL
jgi:hypothetical protein